MVVIDESRQSEQIAHGEFASVSWSKRSSQKP
jgi:hypothetical protein